MMEEWATGHQGPDVAAEAAAIAADLLAAARRGRQPVPELTARLADVEQPGLRRAVTTQLREALTTALTAAWRRGWQPADLHRAAGRYLPATQVARLVEGIRSELATYAPSTVDPHWWHQVHELGDDPGGRRGRRGPGTTDAAQAWRSACADLLGATVFVEHLFPLQVLGPLPGQARQHDHERSAEVDDKLLTKVRRLLAQAEGTPYEAEAETFTAAAQSLMA